MLETIVHWLKDIPREYMVMIVASLPISELRVAIPLALSFNMSLAKAYWFSVLGNTIFIAPALFLFEPVSAALRKLKICSRFFDWVFERTKKNAKAIEKYEALGLAIFVAIPLPMTGAWSGVIAASLFRIRFRYAFIAIVAGVLIAGLIVSLLCALGMVGWKTMVWLPIAKAISWKALVK